jgi:hypothetical protein
MSLLPVEKQADGRIDDRSERMLATLEKLPLAEWQRDFVRDRWWDQINWMDATARRCQRWHRSLRMILIVCGVITPALVSATFGSSSDGSADLVRAAAIAAGLMVAVSTAAEELFRFGPRWRHYRQTSEQVRSEGWMFITLSGPYRRYGTHGEAFRTFARNVEEAFQQDVDAFITNVFRENDRDRVEKPDGPPRPEAPR